jgi:hypothetical protein
MNGQRAVDKRSGNATGPQRIDLAFINEISGDTTIAMPSKQTAGV